jgi:hypothetical protein
MTANLPSSHSCWCLEDIPWGAIELEAIRADRHFLQLVACASFIESAADLYTTNLLRYFEGDAEVSAWLETEWQHEELQHGAALRRYLAEVWPEFDWQPAYDGFLAEYGLLCDDAHLEPTRSLELVSRCVVETGTSSYYRMLAAASPEPVLSLLAEHIRRDEVRHYKHFFHYFGDYRAQEGAGRFAVLRALWGRLREIDVEDERVAFHHVQQQLAPGHAVAAEDYAVFSQRNGEMIRRHFPFRTGIRMLLKPLRLDARVEKLALPLLERGARLALHG